jgi:hypothetical protein
LGKNQERTNLSFVDERMDLGRERAEFWSIDFRLDQLSSQRQRQRQRQRQNARFGWINKQEKSDLGQTDVSFIDQVPRYGRVPENEKVELWRYSAYNLEGSVSI